MINRKHLFTSESVTEGHPDKMADQVSDAILDAILEADPAGRVACETLLTTGLALLAGEIATTAVVDIPAVVRRTITGIGYTDSAVGFDGASCAVISMLHRQAAEIAGGVDRGGAGDQGLMFGYACAETAEGLPLPIHLAHRLARRLAEVRRNHELPWLRPDGKTQVTVEYDGGRPRRVAAVVVSAQHRPEVSRQLLADAICEQVIRPVIPAELLDKDTTIHINPTGSFIQGGPHADCGLTGRKTMVDTYGGSARHGGGAFSGKDPTKVDRSAAYMARYIAKNIVAAELAKEVEVQLAYVIGVADPVSVLVHTFGTGQADEAKLERVVRDIFPLTPRGIIAHLQLNRPIYRRTAAYGHFGRREEGFSWEEPDKVADLLAALR